MFTSEHNGYDVIIIGGGLGGLETGALLAHQGMRALVLERRNVIGGRAMTVEQKGFVLNYGLHYMMGGYESSHYRVLQAIGKTDRVQFAPMNTRQLYRLRGGKLHLTPATLKDMFTTGLLSWKGKLQLLPAMQALFSADPEKLWDVPLGKWLDEVRIYEPTLRNFFLDMVGPLAFETVPSEFSAGHLIIEARKVLTAKGTLALYPAGGWGAVAEVCRQRIEDCGGEVRTKAYVEGLVTDNGSITGVWCNANFIPAKAVVLALPPREIIPLVHDPVIEGLEAAKLAAIRPTMGVAVDLGFIGVRNDRIATIEMPEDNATTGFHNLFQPQLAPKDGLLFQGLRWLTPEQMQDEREVKRTESIFLDRLAMFFPDIRQRVVVRRTLVREVITSATHRYDQPRTSLLPVKVSNPAGLYVVGDATDVPGELSVTVGESALLCAKYLQQQFQTEPARLFNAFRSA